MAGQNIISRNMRRKNPYAIERYVKETTGSTACSTSAWPIAPSSPELFVAHMRLSGSSVRRQGPEPRGFSHLKRWFDAIRTSCRQASYALPKRSTRSHGERGIEKVLSARGATSRGGLRTGSMRVPTILSTISRRGSDRASALLLAQPLALANKGCRSRPSRGASPRRPIAPSGSLLVPVIVDGDDGSPILDIANYLEARFRIVLCLFVVQLAQLSVYSCFADLLFPPSSRRRIDILHRVTRRMRLFRQTRERVGTDA